MLARREEEDVDEQQFVIVCLGWDQVEDPDVYGAWDDKEEAHEWLVEHARVCKNKLGADDHWIVAVTDAG